MRYRKLPVEIDATQWHRNGDHPLDGAEVGAEGKLVRYFRRPDVPGDQECRVCGRLMHDHGWIDTLEGGHIVCPGDWIITGVQGEHYPCKPEIFDATYEAATPDPCPACGDVEPPYHDAGVPDRCRRCGVIR